MDNETGNKAEDVRGSGGGKQWSIKNTAESFEMKGICGMKPRGWIHQPSEHSAPHFPD